jgi:hypothetical protein
MVMEKFLQLPRYAFSRRMIEHAPEEPGVYGLFEGLELIYVGRASDREHAIRACLLAHQDGALGECTMRATTYTWEISLWPVQRESEVLAAFAERYRRAPRCQKKVA